MDEKVIIWFVSRVLVIRGESRRNIEGVREGQPGKTVNFTVLEENRSKAAKSGLNVGTWAGNQDETLGWGRTLDYSPPGSTPRPSFYRLHPLCLRPRVPILCFSPFERSCICLAVNVFGCRMTHQWNFISMYVEPSINYIAHFVTSHATLFDTLV